MSILHEILVSNEAANDDLAAPKTSDAAILDFEAFYPDFVTRAEKVRGRLYAMLKKLSGNDGPVNDDVKYLKTRYLGQPSKLVTRVSENLTEHILFNEELYHYDEKLLNHATARTVCEEHLKAIDQLIDMKPAIDEILQQRKKKEQDAEDPTSSKGKDEAPKTVERRIKNTNRNFQTVAVSLLWSARCILANVRIK